MPGPPPELRRGRGLNNRLSGTWGEELALRYLRRRGYTLVERNYRTRYGELDLIVRHHNTLVFVEVKTRRGVGLGNPLEAVTNHAGEPQPRSPTRAASTTMVTRAAVSDPDAAEAVLAIHMPPSTDTTSTDTNKGAW